MNESQLLAERFEANRTHLRAVAYRMLGSLAEADDAVQEAWLRLNRSGTDGIENLTGWLTTVVARVSLDMLRSRKSRREEPLDSYVPDPIVGREDATNPEHQALLADAVGLALHVVLETLAPDERLAFVLHDMFAVPFDQIATIVDRSPDATRQLASRARRRVQGAPVPDVDLSRQREVVNAFIAATRDGDLEAIVAVLDPDVVLRADGVGRAVVHGARAVAEGAMSYKGLSRFGRPALVNGAAGAVVVRDGKPFAVLGFTVVGDKIVEINVLADRERLDKLDLAVVED